MPWLCKADQTRWCLCLLAAALSCSTKGTTFVSWWFILLYSEDVCKRGFTVIIDMRGSKWDLIKPLLKTLQEAFPAEIHVALIIKPDNFWQKQKTNFGSSKFIFEVRLWDFCNSWGILHWGDWHSKPGLTEMSSWESVYYSWFYGFIGKSTSNCHFCLKKRYCPQDKRERCF